jgi:hypothetical protein
MTLSLLNISTSTMYAIESVRQENVFSLPWAAELVGQILNVQTACVKGRFACMPYVISILTRFGTKSGG